MLLVFMFKRNQKKPTRVLTGILMLWASAAGFAAEKIRPEGVATVSKKPVRLTLSIYKKKIKRRTSLWFKISLKNIGKEKIFLPEEVFFDASEVKIKTSEEINPAGIYLEILGPNGRLDNFGARRNYDPECTPEQTKVLEKDAEKVHEIVEQGIREGISEKEQARRLSERFGKEPLPEVSQESKTIWLPPQASTTTPPWAFRGPCDDRDGIPLQKPIGDFAELPDYKLWFEPAGKFKIRAGYERHESEIMKEIDKEKHRPPSDWEFSAVTPFIDIDVLPPDPEDKAKKLKELQFYLDKARRQGAAELEQYYLRKIDEERHGVE